MPRIKIVRTELDRSGQHLSKFMVEVEESEMGIKNLKKEALEIYGKIREGKK